MIVQSRDRGMVTMISRIEKRVSRWEQIPGPSSHAERKNRESQCVVLMVNLTTKLIYQHFCVKYLELAIVTSTILLYLIEKPSSVAMLYCTAYTNNTHIIHCIRQDFHTQQILSNINKISGL